MKSLEKIKEARDLIHSQITRELDLGRYTFLNGIEEALSWVIGDNGIGNTIEVMLDEKDENIR